MLRQVNNFQKTLAEHGLQLTRDEMEQVPLSRRGRLVSFSVSHDPLRGFPIPYAFGYVMLPEGMKVIKT